MNFNSEYIDFSETDFFGELFLSYVEQKPSLKKYVSDFPDRDGFEARIYARKSVYNREVLAEVIDHQYINARLENDNVFIETTQKAITALKAPTTYTVTTGHQLCLFTGPLYFLYKIATTIKLSNQLAADFPSYKFVPLFWLASEDHDFAEINHLNLFEKQVEWKRKPEGAVGRMRLSGIDEVLSEIKKILGPTPKAKEIIEQLFFAYTQSDNLADATRRLVHSLFGQYGLVIIDGDDLTLKRGFKEYFKRDLFSNLNFETINKTNKSLVESGLVTASKIQVHPRKINCFYLLAQGRERILYNDQTDLYEILNTGLSFNPIELEQEIEEHPERFSPNVVLRPLYQEFLLPNIATIGGPGEINYWLQLKEMFKANSIDYPVLVPRASFLWIEASLNKKIDNLEIKNLELFKSVDVLTKSMVKSRSDIDLKEEADQIDQIFKNLKLKLVTEDASLLASIEGEYKKVINSIHHIENKVLKAQKSRYDKEIHQLVRLKERLFPNHSLQERVDNFLPFYLLYGELFISTLIEYIDPLMFKFQVIKETN